MPQSIYTQVLLLIIVCVSLFAFWQGEREERQAAAVLVMTNMGELLVQQLMGVFSKQYGAFAIDLAAMGLLGMIAWRSTRGWPIWAASFQAVSAAVLLAGLAGLRVSQQAYAAAVNLADYGVVGSVAVGVFMVWREREALAGSSRPLV